MGIESSSSGASGVGNHLTTQYFYWAPQSLGTLEKTISYEAKMRNIDLNLQLLHALHMHEVLTAN